MSLPLGNLRDNPLATLLDGFHRDGRSGVVRLRQSGPAGIERADIVVRDGMVVGAALYRNGGVKGMGDKLVDAALCAPDDALAATERAATVCDDAPGALAAGAARVGVSYQHVVEALADHIRDVLEQTADWSGTAELALEGLPRGGSDRDSAAARAFVLDEGIPPSAILPPPLPPPAPVTDTHAPVFDPFDEPAPGDAPAAADEAAGSFEHPEELTEPEAPVAESPFADDSWQNDPTNPNLPASESVAESAPESEPAPEAESAPEPESDSESEPEPESASEPEASSDDFDESADEPSMGDLSGPGFGESALMEAETLLDGEVLAVMLEMGTSAAAVAVSEEIPEKVVTGDVVLIDDEGLLLPVLVPALRGADLGVHPVKGLAEALARIRAIAASGAQPLVVCDLLLNRGEEEGMLGGLDVAAACAEMSPPFQVLLLCETMSADVEARANAAGARVLPRPLRAELKKDEAIREQFLAKLLATVDEMRPRATWAVGEGVGSADADAAGGAPRTPWSEGEEERGWDVDAIEQRAREVEDLPDLTEDGVERQDALWREAMHLLSSPMSPPEILLQILRFAAEVLGRGVLFTPVGADLVGFGQFGVELAPGVNPDEAVRQIRMPLPPDGHPIVVECVEARAPRRGEPGESTWETYLVRALGGVAPSEIFVGPVFCQGKLAGLLYGDSLGSATAIPDTRNLEVVLGQAGLALDRSVLEARLKALEGGTT